MRALKILVVGMGILIVLGLALVAYGFLGRASKDAKIEKAFGEVTLELPTGCVIAEAQGLDTRLIVRADGPVERGCQQVIVIDTASGEILGRVRGSR